MQQDRNWVELCMLEDIPLRGSRIVHAGKIKIAIIRTHEDEVYAIEDKCPHLGGFLSEGIVHGARVTCPLHNLVIDLKTGEAVAPDTGCVKRFSIKNEDGKILMDLREAASKAA